MAPVEAFKVKQNGQILFDFDDLSLMQKSGKAPIQLLLKQLEQFDFDTSDLRLEYTAMRHFAEMYRQRLAELRKITERGEPVFLTSN